MTSYTHIPKASGIYQIVNLVNGMRYIGSAKNLRSRCKDHFNKLRTGGHHSPYLLNAFKKYGERCFEFFVIEITNDLIATEQSYLDGASSCNLYNICSIAYSHIGVKRSAESLIRMRIASTNRRKPPPFTPEHRQALSVARIGKKLKPETIEKMRLRLKGKPLSSTALRASAEARRKNPPKVSEETKARIRIGHLGLKASPEARLRMRRAKLGKKLSEETKNKMSQARLGKKLSLETRKKISESHINRNRNKTEK